MNFLSILTKPICAIFLILFLCQCTGSNEEPLLSFNKENHVILIGNNLASRMSAFGLFETELQGSFPDSNLFIRNMANPGNTPGFRPHPSRETPWAFPGAEKYHPEYNRGTGSTGHFPSEDDWLESLKADVILAFFGFNESFRGKEKLNLFEEELKAFIDHTLSKQYNTVSAPKLVIISPIAIENISEEKGMPDPEKTNNNLQLYTEKMKDICSEKGVAFVDVFSPSLNWYKKAAKPLTIDGSQLNERGYDVFSKYLVKRIFGKGKTISKKRRKQIRTMVLEKDWMWLNDFKIPNGVHVYGRRFKPYGPDNYPYEIQKIRELTANRDTAVWMVSKGKEVDLEAMDARTASLPNVNTNYNYEELGMPEYLYGQDAIDKFHLADGYKIELFASEKEFPDLANPMQMTFDTKGRLWVATMPSYPHWKPGDGKPNDKIIIFEDTNGDGKADKQTVFADSLHLPIGMAFAPEGLYVSQGNDMVLLKDTNGDGKADQKEIVLSGFDDHDTHHAHNLYEMDPSGAFYLGEGVFLHSNVETTYGPIRGSNGGFFRFSPHNRKLERISQISIPNPWGLAIDDWGQIIFAETSGPDVRWLLPTTVKTSYGHQADKLWSLVDPDHRVRPTSGLEFVSSRHFPDEVQGDFLINNTIGFLGAKQHTFSEDGTGYKSQFRQDLFRSEDKNFRPVDLEFAPDGSLFVLDWHNALIGHMQHNARDPLRDHVHGRIYRITYPSRPLVKPAKIEGASLEELFNNLLVPEYRTRYRTRMELRNRPKKEVLKKLEKWVSGLKTSEEKYEHHLLEALWVSWGMNDVDRSLLSKLLKSKDHRIRAAAVHVLRFTTDQFKDAKELLKRAATDPHGRVKLEAIIAASWLEDDAGLEILKKIDTASLDNWNKPAYLQAYNQASLHGETWQEKKDENTEFKGVGLKGKQLEQYKRGSLIYARDGFCSTCHQTDGKGLKSSGFPPLTGEWVNGEEDRLIKLSLKGLQGPIEVNGQKFPGDAPMTAFEGLLNDQELADVLTYIRNSFGNKAAAVDADKVKKIRNDIKDKKGFYNPSELLKEHPF